MSSEYVAKKDMSQSTVEPAIGYKKRTRESTQRSDDDEIAVEPAPKRPSIQELPIVSQACQASNLSAIISSTISNLERKQFLDLLQQCRQENLVAAFRYNPSNKLVALQYCANLIRGEISLLDFITSWKKLCEEEDAAKRAAQVAWEREIDSMAELAPSNLKSIGTLTTFFELINGRVEVSELEHLLEADEIQVRAVERALQLQIERTMEDFFSRLPDIAH